jgi:hypothetical protein
MHSDPTPLVLHTSDLPRIRSSSTTGPPHLLSHLQRPKCTGGKCLDTALGPDSPLNSTWSASVLLFTVLISIISVLAFLNILQLWLHLFLRLSSISPLAVLHLDTLPCCHKTCHTPITTHRARSTTIIFCVLQSIRTTSSLPLSSVLSPGPEVGTRNQCLPFLVCSDATVCCSSGLLLVKHMSSVFHPRIKYLHHTS